MPIQSFLCIVIIFAACMVKGLSGFGAGLVLILPLKIDQHHAAFLRGYANLQGDEFQLMYNQRFQLNIGPLPLYTHE